MKKIIFYLCFVILTLSFLIFQALNNNSQFIPQNLKVGLLCAFIGGIGGTVYCLRAVYLNACVKKCWDINWEPWYYIRPIVSVICGGISYLFLRAGLIILESSPETNSSDLGFYALAFIAGLNVDKFISKIEDLAQAVWGIEKSRSGKE